MSFNQPVNQASVDVVEDDLEMIDKSLDDSDKILVHKSFKEFEGNLTHSGLSVLLRLFQEYPGYKIFWPTCRNVPDSSLMDSEVLRQFASTLMTGLHTIVENLNDNQKLNRQLCKIAKAHHVHGITKTHIEHMLPMVLATLDVRSSALDAAWTRLFEMISVRLDKFREKIEEHRRHHL